MQISLCIQSETEMKGGGRLMTDIVYAVVPNLGESLLLSVEDYKTLRDNYEATPT